MNETFPNEKKDSLELIRFFIRHFKTLALAVFFAGTAAVCITFFIDKEYLSYGIVFPTSSNSLEATYENPILGYDIEADRLIQMLQSGEIQDSVIRKFNLIGYYEIDTTISDWKDRLKLKYGNDIKYNRTLFMSVQITAKTKDPKLSADIVNTLIDLLNHFREKVLKTNIELACKSLKKEYDEQKYLLDTLVSGINRMKEVARDPALLLLSNQNISINVNASSKDYKNNTYLEWAINTYDYEQKRLNEITTKYERAKAMFERPVTSIYIIDRGIPSYKKVSPSYSKNAMIAALAAFVITLTLLFVKEELRRLRKEVK